MDLVLHSQAGKVIGGFLWQILEMHHALVSDTVEQIADFQFTFNADGVSDDEVISILKGKSTRGCIRAVML